MSIVDQAGLAFDESGSQDPNDEHLSRVAGGMNPLIQQFLSGKLQRAEAHDIGTDENEAARTFTAAELDKRVRLFRPTAAPGSADRVLRAARKNGYCDVTLVSRSKSLYRVDGCKPLREWK